MGEAALRLGERLLGADKEEISERFGDSGFDKFLLRIRNAIQSKIPSLIEETREKEFDNNQLNWLKLLKLDKVSLAEKKDEKYVFISELLKLTENDLKRIFGENLCNLNGYSNSEDKRYSKKIGEDYHDFFTEMQGDNDFLNLLLWLKKELAKKTNAQLSNDRDLKMQKWLLSLCKKFLNLNKPVPN